MNIYLTFDDGFSSHYELVAPLLSKYGFKATFFICVNITKRAFKNNKYMQGHAISCLHGMGFEIGNHFARHCDITSLTEHELLDGLERSEHFFKCRLGIDTTSFCPPGYHYNDTVKKHIKKRFKCARIGCNNDLHSFTNGGLGPILPKGPDQHQLYCSVMGSKFSILNAIDKINNMGDDDSAIFCFHGINDHDSPLSWKYEHLVDLVDFMALKNVQCKNLSDLVDTR